MFLARSDVSFVRDALIVLVIDDVIIEHAETIKISRYYIR